MKPTDQTKFHDCGREVRGNCLRASIASVLEIGIDEMPPFEDQGCLGDAFKQWCAMSHLVPVLIYSPNTAPAGYSVALGYANRNGCSVCGIAPGHAVVALDGQCVFDPHPSRAGLVSVEMYLVFEKI